MFKTQQVNLSQEKIWRSQYHSYNTRCRGNLIYPMHNLTLVEHTNKYMGMTFYDKLPNTIKDIAEINKITNTVKEILTGKMYCVYSPS